MSHANNVKGSLMDVGLGIRPEIFEQVADQHPSLGLLEAHSENYFGESIALTKLRSFREHYPVSLHGVGLSLGRADDLDQNHLKQLKQLVKEIDPVLVSEHLAWSAYSHRHLPDLLPLPLNEQSLNVMCQHIQQMQDALQRQILIENPSNYLLFDQLQIPEPEFLNTLAKRTGCGLLVDVNNIYVSACNLNRDANDYITQLNSDAIFEYHLAGHTQGVSNKELILIDTHNQPVSPHVWSIFESAIKEHGMRPTIVEWDSDFPELAVLLAECDKAKKIVEKTANNELDNDSLKLDLSRVVIGKSSIDEGGSASTLADMEAAFLDEILEQKEITSFAVDAHKPRLSVYQNNVYVAIGDYLEEVYPGVKGVVGDAFFKQMTQVYTRLLPPSHGDINAYGGDFNRVLKEFDALSDLAYLADLIEYEWALHVTYFSAVEEPLVTSDYEQHVLLSLPVKFNSSVRIIQADCPLYEIHRQSLPDFTHAVKINLNDSQDTILVYKNGHRVEARVLTVDEIAFFKKVQESSKLLQAIQGIEGSLQAESLSAVLALVFELQLLCVA